jgi:eukaryotic-like serine/threonine-protein kinase
MSNTPCSLTRLVFSSLCGLVTLAISPLAPAAPTNALTRRGDWTQGEFNAGHSSHNTSERTINPSNVHSLQLAWTASLVGTIYATPIVANGRVYLGGGDGRMHAFDATTGAPQWTSKNQGSFYVGSATYADGLVFANAIYAPLTAFNATTGKVVWTSSVVTDLRAPAAAHGHTLYAGNFDGTLYALDTRTGDVLWSSPGGCCIFDQAPAVSGGRVFQLRTDGTLTAYDAADGTQLWTVSDFSVGTMAAVDGKLIFGHYPNVVARDQATGALLWTAPYFQSAAQGSPAVADGLVFAESNLSDLVALDENTGTLVWTASARSYWGPSVANGVVYASNYSGEWDAYKETDGTLLWSVTNDDGCFGPCTNTLPVVARGMLYLASGELRAYKIAP